MTLSPEMIEHAKKEINIQQYFIRSEVCTPKHLLFKEFTEKTKWANLPKIIFYILMDELYPRSIAKAPNGDLGYLLEIYAKPIEETINDERDQPNMP